MKINDNGYVTVQRHGICGRHQLISFFCRSASTVRSQSINQSIFVYFRHDKTQANRIQ